MNEVNRLIIDCLARVLRINQTTDADISFQVYGQPATIICYGYKNGFVQAVTETDGNPVPDFTPILGSNFMEPICYKWSSAEQKLHDLLASLDVLERELMQSA